MTSLLFASFPGGDGPVHLGSGVFRAVFGCRNVTRQLLRYEGSTEEDAGENGSTLEAPPTTHHNVHEPDRAASPLKHHLRYKNCMQLIY